MRVRRVLLSVIALMAFQICAANALDFGRVAGGILGQVLDNAVRGGNSAPVQQQPQQQQTTEYSTDYQQYMEGSAAPQTQATQQSEDTDWFDEPAQESTAAAQATGGDEGDSDDLFGNADAAVTDADTPEEDEDLFGNAGGDSGTGSGGASGDTIEVVATGIGKDSDSALRSALRAAVEQAVGTLIDSETLIENDETVNDQILSYSAGFVQSHDQIGEPKTQDGLVTIRIRALVKKTELTQKLEAASLHVSDVDGEDLFGEAVSKIEQNQAAEEIVKNAFADYPYNVMEIRRSGKPNYDEREKKWIIPVELSVNRDKYRTFIREVAPILKKVSTDAPQRITMKVDKYNDHIRMPDMYRIRGNFIRLCININDARTTAIWESYPVPEEAIKGLYSAVNAPKFTVDIVDNLGDPITSGTYNAPVPYNIYRHNISPCLILPILDEHGDNDSEHYTFNPGNDKATYNLSFDVSPEEFKRMKNVVCRIDK